MVPPAIRVIALAALLLLAGCGERDRVKLFEPVVVKEAVAVKAAPPPELMQPYRTTALPRFVDRGHASAAFCVDPLGAASIKALTLDLIRRDAAWREWASTPLPTAAAPVKP